jgi:DNA invertase Pin-like site-specific DNA recombinase
MHSGTIPITEFERELIQERIRSGIAAAKARGKRLGRQPGQGPKSNRLAPKVLALVAAGRSYRLIGRELGLARIRSPKSSNGRGLSSHKADLAVPDMFG